MFWALYDSQGRRYGSFDEEEVARAFLLSTTRERPELADELILLGYNDNGEPVGDGIMLEDVLASSTRSASNGRPEHVWANFRFPAQPVVTDRVDEPVTTP